MSIYDDFTPEQLEFLRKDALDNLATAQCHHRALALDVFKARRNLERLEVEANVVAVELSAREELAVKVHGGVEHIPETFGHRGLAGAGARNEIGLCGMVLDHQEVTSSNDGETSNVVRCVRHRHHADDCDAEGPRGS